MGDTMKLPFKTASANRVRAVHDGAAYEAFRICAGWCCAIYRPADNQFAEWSEYATTLKQAKTLLERRAREGSA